VETTAQLAELRNRRVNEVQVVLLSRPLDPDVLETTILAPARRAVSDAGRP
jgi:EAL domain-containing protein (putative c-di-GMP-specific phosphodiesterase class I)